jgi:hypothetical protein
VEGGVRCVGARANGTGGERKRGIGHRVSRAKLAMADRWDRFGVRCAREAPARMGSAGMGWDTGAGARRGCSLG